MGFVSVDVSHSGGNCYEVSYEYAYSDSTSISVQTSVEIDNDGSWHMEDGMDHEVQAYSIYLELQGLLQQVVWEHLEDQEEDEDEFDEDEMDEDEE